MEHLLFQAVTAIPLCAVSFMGVIQLILIAAIMIFRATLPAPDKGNFA